MTTNYDEISINDLHALTSADLMKISKEEKLIRTGKYLTKVRQVFDRTSDESAEFNAGRRTLSLAVTFYDPDDATKKVGDAFLKVSPEPRFIRGKLDVQANRYVELARTLGVLDGDPDRVITACEAQMFMTKVRETYKVAVDDLHPTHQHARTGNDGDAWVTLNPEDEEEREHYLELGIEPRCNIDRIYKVSVKEAPTSAITAPVVRKRATRTVEDDNIPF